MYLEDFPLLLNCMLTFKNDMCDKFPPEIWKQQTADVSVAKKRGGMKADGIHLAAHTSCRLPPWALFFLPPRSNATMKSEAAFKLHMSSGLELSWSLSRIPTTASWIPASASCNFRVSAEVPINMNVTNFSQDLATHLNRSMKPQRGSPDL